MHRLSLLLATTLLLPPLAHADTLTGEAVLDGLQVSERDRERMLNGEVLAFDGEPYEATRRELAADATVLVDRSLDEVLALIREAPTIIPQKYLVEYADIESEADFAEIGFRDEDYEEANKFLQAKPGKHFNLSQEEIDRLKQLDGAASSRAERLEAASGALREILLQRYRAYRADGLDGIAEYRRSSRKAVSAGKDLALTTETFQPFEKYFPAYYRVMRHYPQGAGCCEHVFRWLKVKLRKRPTWALSHTFIEAKDDQLLITERHYYVTSTLNNVQVTMSWLPWDEDTQMGLAVSASTDLLDSLMGKMLRPLGRNKARDLVSDVMTEIRDDLEAPPD